MKLFKQIIICMFVMVFICNISVLARYYLLEEQFETDTSNWSILGNTTITSTITASPNSSGKALYLSGLNISLKRNKYIKNISDIPISNTGKTVFECDFYIDELAISDTLFFQLNAGSIAEIPAEWKFIIIKGDGKIYTGENVDTNVTYQKKAWNKIRIMLNHDTKTFAVSLVKDSSLTEIVSGDFKTENDWLVKVNSSGVCQIMARLDIEAGTAHNVGVYLDNLVYYQIQVPVVNTLTISGESVIGFKLTALPIYDQPLQIDADKTRIKWYSSEEQNTGFTEIIGSVGANYTLTESDVNKWIRVGVIPENIDGIVGEEVFSKAVLITASLKPYASNVKLDKSNYIVGQTAKGTYTYGSDEGIQMGNNVFCWYISDTSDGKYTAIDNSNNENYIVKQSDRGKFIKFGVTPVDENNVFGNEVVSDYAEIYHPLTFVLNGDNQAENVDKLELQYNYILEDNSANTEKFMVNGISPSTVEQDDNKCTLIFSPQLQDHTEYTLTVDTGAVTDIYGQKSDATSINFKTKRAILRGTSLTRFNGEEIIKLQKGGVISKVECYNSGGKRDAIATAKLYRRGIVIGETQLIFNVEAGESHIFGAGFIIVDTATDYIDWQVSFVGEDAIFKLKVGI